VKREPTVRQQRLIGLIDTMNVEQGYCRTPDIAQALGINDRAAYKRLTRLVNRGLIVREQSTLPQEGTMVDYYSLPASQDQ
jgi:predicted transcriptional regulator